MKRVYELGYHWSIRFNFDSSGAGWDGLIQRAVEIRLNGFVFLGEGGPKYLLVRRTCPSKCRSIDQKKCFVVYACYVMCVVSLAPSV